MNQMVDLSRADVKLGKYAIAPASALADSTLATKAVEARRSLSQRMVALDRDGAAKLQAGDYLVSKKVDGEFSMLAFNGDEAVLVNAFGTVKLGLPALDEAAERLRAAGIGSALIAAELYVARPDGKRARVHDVVRVGRKPETKADVESLRLAVFDVLSVDGKAPGPKFAETWALVQKVFGGGKLIRPVEAVPAKTAGDVLKRFGEWVEQGREEGLSEEGLVVRSDAYGMFKVKPRFDLDVAVVGYSEAIGDRAGMLHDLLIAVVRQDGTYHLLGRVGGGFSDEDRRAILSDLKDKAVASDYIETNTDHVAYQMVRPEWVVEVSVLDLVSQSSRGAPIDRMVLAWDPKENKWSPTQRLPLASPISPVYVRRREEKQPVAADAGIKQVAEIVDVPMADRDARSLVLAPSKVVKREVYTKVMKGAKLVRKLVLWKTNKKDQPGYYEWVVYVVDFSPNREEKLKRDMRVTNSDAQAEALWSEFKAEYVKGGWAKA